MSPYKKPAEAAGWFPTHESHIMFRQSKGVCRHLKGGEVYNCDTDSLMSSPLRHANNWKQACEMDGLTLENKG